MKNKYTVSDFWAFVNRAETRDQCTIAMEWLCKHFPEEWGDDLYDELQDALAFKIRDSYWNEQNLTQTLIEDLEFVLSL